MRRAKTIISKSSFYLFLFLGAFTVASGQVTEQQAERIRVAVPDKATVTPKKPRGLIEQIYIRAKAHYGDDANSTQVVKLIEDSMGDYLRAEGVEYTPLHKNDF